jgi:hypothetical protein
VIDKLTMIAQTIARELGDDLEMCFENKSDWISQRGTIGGQFRDINLPFRQDYLNAANAVIKLLEE